MLAETNYLPKARRVSADRPRENLRNAERRVHRRRDRIAVNITSAGIRENFTREKIVSQLNIAARQLSV